MEATTGGSAFYRPPAKKSSPERPLPADFPFREKKAGANEDEDEPFLRSRRRVAVRRGIIPRGRWGRIGITAGVVALTGGLVWLAIVIRHFAAHDPRFRIDSSENIQILGNSEVTQAELLSVFGGDMGRNVFFVPLQERRADLERLPWVERATVMRLLPDQLRVAVVERTPIAFVRTGNKIGLVDRDGVLLAMDPKTIAAKHYSFAVVTGITASDPQSTRSARMKLYQRFVAELDSGGDKISNQLSEVDLSDPEDVRAVVASEGSDLLLHLGDQDFLTRWRNYQQHLTEWKQEYPKLASVDLRYERQVVLEMQKGASIAPGQDAAGKTMDDLKAEASAISPRAARQMAAASKKTGIKKPAPRRSAATFHDQPVRN
ncbi:Cell division protein FtsQ [Acidisarcina polymorpha]|uniref:Cell division protein FtsQ n=1 Tax=Acidisarcina polymorpha TaxID=2211140 RepID=A0A2Z5FV19_9BACT|nr:Cell division protein FtsQ [Acidisarcina polymorpha]